VYGRDLVGLIVPGILALCLVGTERHQPVHLGIVQGKLDHVPPGTVPADDIAIRSCGRDIARAGGDIDDPRALPNSGGIEERPDGLDRNRGKVVVVAESDVLRRPA
jgi:hypothetical protein